jgi:hypothetical protein
MKDVQGRDIQIGDRIAYISDRRLKIANVLDVLPKYILASNPAYNEESAKTLKWYTTPKHVVVRNCDNIVVLEV